MHSLGEKFNPEFGKTLPSKCQIFLFFTCAIEIQYQYLPITKMNGLLYGIQITTLSGWLACSVGYVAGFRIPQTWQLHFPEKPKPMQVIHQIDFTLGSPLLAAENTTEAANLPPSHPSDSTPQTQELPSEPTPPEMVSPAPPTMPELATIAALPDIPEIPAQVIRKVANRVASPSSNKTNSEKKPTSTNNSNTAPSTATNLTFGNGAGRQPSPQYPYQARRANQQGTVVIEFIVGMDGRVLSAWVKSPCAWPLLNNSALSTVRSSWKFPSGSPRRYRIPIVFRLS